MNETQALAAAREAVRTRTVIDQATARALAYFWTDNNLTGVWALRAFALRTDDEYMPGVLREVDGLLAYIERDKGTDWEDNRAELQALRDYAASMIG